MENICTTLIEEEIFYYQTQSNFGVLAKNLKLPKSLQISYSPFSSNQKVSFSNTIMIPYITTEASIDNEKNMNQNISNFKSGKNTISFKREDTRFKTEFSKDKKNNMNIEKQIIKIFFDNKTDNID